MCAKIWFGKEVKTEADGILHQPPIREAVATVMFHCTRCGGTVTFDSVDLPNNLIGPDDRPCEKCRKSYRVYAESTDDAWEVSISDENGNQIYPFRILVWPP